MNGGMNQEILIHQHASPHPPSLSDHCSKMHLGWVGGGNSQSFKLDWTKFLIYKVMRKLEDLLNMFLRRDLAVHV